METAAEAGTMTAMTSSPSTVRTQCRRSGIGIAQHTTQAARLRGMGANAPAFAVPVVVDRC